MEWVSWDDEGNFYDSGEASGTSLVGLGERLQGMGSSGSAVVETSDGSTYGIKWATGDHGSYIVITKYLETIDGGNPMPYTGNWSGGAFKPKNPGTIGGSNPEDDSARIMPVIRNSGLGNQGGGGINSTDGPSIWDDGNWYGGIFGGGSNILSDNQPGVVDPAHSAGPSEKIIPR